MTAKTYFAVIKTTGTPKILKVIGEGSRDRCAGAIDAYIAAVGLGADDKAVIVVEVAE